MAERFVTNMIETVERTMEIIKEREKLKQNDRALKSQQAKAARTVRDVRLSQRRKSLSLDSATASPKLPGDH